MYNHSLESNIRIVNAKDLIIKYKHKAVFFLKIDYDKLNA